MNRLIVIGAGGHGKVIVDNALKNGYANICFIDDNASGDIMGFPVIGTSKDLEKFNDGNTDFVIGIGKNEIRKIISEKHDLNWVTIIHPSAQLAFNVSIGKGTVVMANAVINVNSKIGEHCIINTGAIIEHDNIIDDFVHISPNAALGGTVRVGLLTHVGIGAVVKNNIEICSGCTIGAGAVVIRDINISGTYIGVPVKKINYNS